MPVCFSSRSRSTHITRFNNRWIILSDGSGEGINANPASDFGVAYDHFQWSRSSTVWFSNYLWITFSDGSPNYGDSSRAFFTHGVAYDHFGGRGVFILVSVATTGTLYGLEILRVVPMDIVVLILFTELPMFAFICLVEESIY